MEAEQTGKMTKKVSSIRKKTQEGGEFQSQLTVQLDEFFRHFNYYYPGKNKEEIINKCLTGNIYWITLDSIYYPDNIDFEVEKIALFRKKAQLKNGTFPPTKDSLEEEKYILTLRKITSANLHTLNITDIRDTPISQVQQYLQNYLLNHEHNISHQLVLLNECLAKENSEMKADLERLTIPIIKSSKLFAYEHLEKEVINTSILKATQKEKQPRCDFCFTRDKDIVKCRTENCNFYTHSSCFPRLARDFHISDFQCDGCLRQISVDAQCQLCPTRQGHFLELNNILTSKDYKLVRGDSNLKFKVKVAEQEGKLEKTFIHVSCFVLHPQCSYNQMTGLVEGLHLIDRTRKNINNCSLCGNMLGMTVPCNNENCRRSFHPECAKRNSLSINVIKANNKALLQIYCERHKKPESFQYLKDSSSNRIRQLRKFYENVDYQLKRSNVFHNSTKLKKANKSQELLKLDRCLNCGDENDYQHTIINCMRCYGWHHQSCCNICPYCDA